MKKVFFSLIILLTGAAATGQRPGLDRRLSFEIKYHDLYSTHRNHFKGVSFSVSKPVSPMLVLGVGTEFSGNKYHFDNDWNLYDLRFLPVFFEQQLKPAINGWLCPAFHFCEGWSYASYQKETLAEPGKRRSIHEGGLYLYGGGGLTGNLSDRLSLAAEAGIKGFHNSFNALDVNPHGLTGKLGLMYRGGK